MSDGWEIVRTVGTDEEATLIRGFLESEGIAAQVESLVFHQEPVTFGRLGEVRVRVPAAQSEEARRLLAGLDADPSLEQGADAAGLTDFDDPTA